MQILNISVQNRPAKSLTSLLYLPYFVDSLGVGWSAVTVKLRTIMNNYEFVEPIGVTYNISRMMLRSTLVDVKPPTESLASTYQVTKVMLLDTLTKVSAPVESLGSTYKVVKVSLRAALLSTSIPKEELGVTYSVTTMKLG